MVGEGKSSVSTKSIFFFLLHDLDSGYSVESLECSLPRPVTLGERSIHSPGLQLVLLIKSVLKMVTYGDKHFASWLASSLQPHLLESCLTIKVEQDPDQSIHS